VTNTSRPHKRPGAVLHHGIHFRQNFFQQLALDFGKLRPHLGPPLVRGFDHLLLLFEAGIAVEAAQASSDSELGKCVFSRLKQSADLEQAGIHRRFIRRLAAAHR